MEGVKGALPAPGKAMLPQGQAGATQDMAIAKTPVVATPDEVQQAV